MASLVGLVAGGLLGAIIAGTFTKQTQQLTQQYNIITERLSGVIQTAMQSTAQTAVITQRVVLDGSNINCAEVNITNTAAPNMNALGTFNVQSTAQVQNWIMNEITSSMTNDTNVSTAAGAVLPNNVTNLQMVKNIHDVVRQVYTSDNLNTMLQSLQVNQVIDLSRTSVQSTGICTISNFSAPEMLARNSLEVLSAALFQNKTTNKFMDNMSNTYTGRAQGIFSPISDFFTMLQWLAIALAAVIVVVVIAGVIVKLVGARKPTPAILPQPAIAK